MFESFVDQLLSGLIYFRAKTVSRVTATAQAKTDRERVLVNMYCHVVVRNVWRDVEMLVSRP